MAGFGDWGGFGANGGAGGSGSGSPSWASLPKITIVSQSAVAHASSAVTNSVTTPSGLVNGDCLFEFGAAVEKPTSAISCPSGFTLLETGGQLSDGTNQPQVAICSHLVVGGEASSYAYTWSGSSFANGWMVDIRGLTECTATDAVYAGGNTSSNTVLAAGTVGAFGPGEINLYASAGNGNYGLSPYAFAQNDSATAAAFGFATGSMGASGFAGSNMYYAIAGVLMH